MSAIENKKFVEQIFSELAQGNAKPFVESMADDFIWCMHGGNTWSRRFEGKQAVVKELFGALRDVLQTPIVTVGHRFIADGDYVAVEARGKNTTKAGKPYNNTYCFVFRLANGKLQEVTEYMDTELVTRALGAFPNVPV